MAGTVLYRKGRHWSRQSNATEVSASTNQELIRAFHRFTNYRISESNLMQLLRAVAWARHYHLHATSVPLPTRLDSKRQLDAMLKLDDAQLQKAIEDCDTGTRAAISEAENALPEIKWVETHSETDSLTIQILAPESVRDAIRLALSKIQKQTTKRGRKEKPYQLDLARACLKVWREYYQPKTPKRLDFCREAFDAAGMHLGDKSLEALLSEAGKGRIK